MFDLLLDIRDLFLSFFNWVSSLIEDIANLVKRVSEAASLLPSLFSWLPASVWVLLSVGFSVVVAYKILGREG